MSSARCLFCANTSPALRYHPFKSMFRGARTLPFSSKSTLLINLLNVEFLREFPFSIHSRYGRLFLRRQSVKLSCLCDTFLGTRAARGHSPRESEATFKGGAFVLKLATP
jgi:hypothetical protein